jgi:hypothetical protein
MTLAARTANRPVATMATSPQGDSQRPACAGQKARAGSPSKGLPAPAVDWLSRLQLERMPRVVNDTRTGDRLLIPTPLAVGDELARVAFGQVVTFSQLRARLAERHGADRACPLATGIAAAVLAGVVAGELRQRRKPRWPVWRLVKDGGLLPPNWVLDPLYRASVLREEGREVRRAGAGWRVS